VPWKWFKHFVPFLFEEVWNMMCLYVFEIYQACVFTNLIIIAVCNIHSLVTVN